MEIPITTYILLNKGKNGKEDEWWNIKVIQNSLGSNTCRWLLFFHAFLGCDTVEIFFKIGKGVPLRNTSSSNYKELCYAAELFLSETATEREIVAAGERAIVALYGGCGTETLNDYRFQYFQKKLVIRAFRACYSFFNQ